MLIALSSYTAGLSRVILGSSFSILGDLLPIAKNLAASCELGKAHVVAAVELLRLQAPLLGAVTVSMPQESTKPEPLVATLGMSACAAVVAEATTLPFDTAKVGHGPSTECWTIHL